MSFFFWRLDWLEKKHSMSTVEPTMVKQTSKITICGPPPLLPRKKILVFISRKCVAKTKMQQWPNIRKMLPIEIESKRAIGVDQLKRKYTGSSQNFISSQAYYFSQTNGMDEAMRSDNRLGSESEFPLKASMHTFALLQVTRIECFLDTVCNKWMIGWRESLHALARNSTAYW